MNSGVALLLLALLSALNVRAQGTFLYDQQSSDENYLGGGGVNIQSGQPLGQSFTPSLSTIGFIRLYLSDDAFDSLGATLRINLRTTSISGTILASTDPVSVPDRFVGSANFFFNQEDQLTPGTVYYFQPEVVAGGPFGLYAYNTFGYAAGTLFYQGAPSPSFDLWFREGIIVPEPGTWALLLLGFGAICWRRVRLR